MLRLGDKNKLKYAMAHALAMYVVIVTVPVQHPNAGIGMATHCTYMLQYYCTALVLSLLHPGSGTSK